MPIPNKYPHTIFLLNDNDVDSTAESCRIQRVVGIPHGAKRVSHVLHATALVWEAGMAGGLLSSGGDVRLFLQ